MGAGHSHEAAATTTKSEATVSPTSIAAIPPSTTKREIRELQLPPPPPGGIPQLDALVANLVKALVTKTVDVAVAEHMKAKKLANATPATPDAPPTTALDSEVSCLSIHPSILLTEVPFHVV